MAKNLPLIDSTGLVINVVHIEDGADWSPPDGHTLGPEGGAIGDRWDGASYIKPAPTPIDIEALRTTRISEAWTECQRRCETDTIIVTTSAGELPFGIGQGTRDNLQSIVVGIEIMPAGTVANPRPFSPKGLAPAQLTHDDFRAVAVAVGRAYDQRMQCYFAHKQALKKLSNAEQLQTYKLIDGWPPPNVLITVDGAPAPERVAAIQATLQQVIQTLHDLGSTPPA